MKRAFVFPGQGSQKVGMGKALYDAFPEAKEVFQEVDDALHENLSKLIFEGDEEELKLTSNAQPALMTVSMAVLRVLSKQVGGMCMRQSCSYVAGHSLGEYAALCAAKALSLTDTAVLLRKRGEAMQKAVPVGVGGMAALMGATPEEAASIAAEAAGDQVCTCANDNAVGQVVISGHMDAIDRAIEIAAARGFKRSIKLPVSAPFHSLLMQPAAEVMAEALSAVVLQEPRVPVVANVTAQPVTDPDEIRRLLVVQICGSVRWRESVLFMKEQGVEQLVECGSGKVLAGLTKRIDKSVQAVSLETPEDIDSFMKEYGDTLHKSSDECCSA